jgi:Fanconi anemia group M protein|tara:strand:+ start:692 stop:1357 length:666 start_codon:yes stop_codon:yes gene_type:complete
MKIIVDHRERSSGIIKDLIKKGIDVEEKQLEVADFIIQTKTLDNKRINVGIERKTQNDFLNSIADKRIIKQLLNLKDNFDVPLLILEGVGNIYSIRNYHPNAIRGMTSSIALDFQVPIINTRNSRDTAAYLEIVAKRLEKGRTFGSLLGKRKPTTPKEQQELIVETFPGIGSKLSKSLLKQFKTIKSLVNVHKKTLQKVEKVGPIKAKKIKELLERDYNKK